MRTEFLCISVLRVASGPRVKLASCKSALNPPPPPPPVVYSTDRSKAVVPVLVLLFVALWFNSTRRFVLCLTLCHFALVFFIPFSITSLGGERAHLSAFLRLFDLCLFGFVCFLFLLVSGKGLRFVIVALPGLFSYPIFACSRKGTAHTLLSI